MDLLAPKITEAQLRTMIERRGWRYLEVPNDYGEVDVCAIKGYKSVWLGKKKMLLATGEGMLEEHRMGILDGTHQEPEMVHEWEIWREA